jgi:hypothetical protein
MAKRIGQGSGSDSVMGSVALLPTVFSRRAAVRRV